MEISIVSESMPHLRRGANKDFLKIMKMTNRFIPENYNKTYMTYTFENGSYIEFFSVDDESKLRGARRHILYVNEANNISFDAYHQLQIRTSKDIFLDFNPTNTFWAHSEVMKEPDAELLILNYKDNEGLEKEIIESLEMNRVKAITSNYWKNWCKVYLDGEIGILEGVIFNDFEIIDNIPTDARLICYGMDFGYTNDPSTVIAIYKYNDELIFDEIIYQKGLSNRDLSKLLKSNNVIDEIYADSAEPKSINEIKNYGFKILPVTKGKDSIMYGIGLMQDYKFSITKKSVNTIDEFRKYSWKKDKNGNTLNTPIDIWNHCIDAIRYGIMMKLNNKKKVGKTFIFR